MECKKAQELILTNYLDGQMDDVQRVRLKIHFATCPGCEEFASIAKKAVIDPIARMKRVSAPESLWPRIKEAIIAAEQPEAGLVARFREKAKLIFAIPRLAFTFATAILFISVVGIVTQVQLSKRVSLQEQAEYPTNSLSVGLAAPTDSGADFGTSIEEYFL